MSTRNTANQAAPFPDVNEPLNNVNDWIYNLAIFQEVRGVQRFATQAELSSKRPTPSSGEFCWIVADKVLQVFDGTAWKRVYPPQPMVYSGTTTPASSLGAVGDLYIKTT
jgi:hypothetical protein